MTELELVQRTKAGDRAAITELIDAHYAKVHRLALHILRNESDAEDASQNAFVKVITNIRLFDERRALTPWLLSIVTRECLMIQRSERTRLAFWQRWSRADSHEESVESVVQVKQECRDLWRAVNRLKTDHRLVLILSYFMGMSEADVAVTLDIKLGTVKSRKHTALRRLRALLEQEVSWDRGQLMAEGVAPEAISE